MGVAALAMALVLGAQFAVREATAATGASVTNRDDRDHKVTIIEGDAKADHMLKPNQVLEGICLKGCVLRLNDSEDDEYQLEVNDVVSIEDGFLYYDGPDAPAETPDQKGQPGGKTPEKK
jgi:hypothetical protein